MVERVRKAYTMLECCECCGHRCKVNRRNGKLGTCQTGERAMISSFGAHMGEEPPLTGRRGSGTIFFTRCNLRCRFCQNYDISQLPHGREVEPEDLARIMLDLQMYGCHNINLVSPTHVVAPILAAVLVAAGEGLTLPLVYNTGGYDSLSTLELLDGVIDIYMPDMKYAAEGAGRLYSKARGYPKVNREAVAEMHRQVGDLVCDEHGIARRGLIVRHLVLPNRIAGTKETAVFVAEKISRDTYFNLMDQYHPDYLVRELPQINRRASAGELEEAARQVEQAGLHRGPRPAC